MGTREHHHLRLHHLLALAVALLLAFGAGGASAVINPVLGWRATSAYPWADKESACKAYISDQSNASSVYVITFVSVSDTGQCHAKYVRRSDGGVQNADTIIITLAKQTGTGTSCPANGALSGGVCVCSSGYVESSDQTSCVLPPDPCAALAGQSAGDWWKDVGVNAAGTGPKNGGSFSVCDGYNPQGGSKCVVTVANPKCVNSDDDGVSGFWRCTGNGVYTGARAVAGKCDLATAGSGDTPADPSPSTPPVPNTDPPKAPDKPDPNTAAPAPCPAGYAPGTVNGSTSCYPKGSDGPSSGGSSSSTKNPDGSTTTTTNQTQCSAGGDKCDTTTTTTNCPAGANGTTSTSCTTTTSSSSASQSGTCAKDPGNTVCKGTGDGAGSSFGGDCKSGFKAQSEDAVINAMALEQYKRNCTFFGKDEDPASTANMAKSGADGKNTDAMKSAAAGAPVSVGSFDTSGYGWGTACPADPSIPIPWGAGGNLVIPFSRLCGPLSLLSLAGVALTLLGCMVWVVGPKQGGA